jgi:PD-(D/E)XK nuclease superfamily
MVKLDPTSQSVSSSHQPVNRSELERFFADISSRVQLPQTDLAHASSRPPVDQCEPEEDRANLQRFFADVDKRVQLTETLRGHLDKWLATRFNVFDLIEPDENKLSDVLAGLLDPKGNHGQGDLFLRLLFERLGLGSDPKLHTKDATVRREAPMHGMRKDLRRMDVFVDAGVLLAIENKVDSPEQQDQVSDYLVDLERRCPCPPGQPIQNTLIYLTPDRRPPELLNHSELENHQKSGRLHCWTYQDELGDWLEDCRLACEAQKIRDFLSDFIAYIESDLKRESEDNQEKQDNEDNE